MLASIAGTPLPPAIQLRGSPRVEFTTAVRSPMPTGTLVSTAIRYRHTVPEPTTVGLIAAAGFGLGGLVRRKVRRRTA